MIKKHKEFIGDSTRVVQRLQPNGFVAKQSDLEVLDSTIRESPVFSTNTSTPSYMAFLSNGDTVRFGSLTDLLAHPNAEPEVIIGIEVAAGATKQQQVGVLLEPDGDITLDITGPTHVVEGAAHTLRQRLRALDQRYPWAARAFVLSSRFRRLTSSLVVMAFLAFVFCVGMYVYGRLVGVEVDPNLIPEGMTYYQKVENAIASTDTEQKLNVLLMGHYRHFINVSEYLAKYRTRAVFALGIFAVLSLLAWVSRHMTRYYPRAYFALGRRADDLRRLEKGRDAWVFGIIAAFLVNVVAGVLILVFGG